MSLEPHLNPPACLLNTGIEGVCHYSIILFWDKVSHQVGCIGWPASLRGPISASPALGLQTCTVPCYVYTRMGRVFMSSSHRRQEIARSAETIMTAVRGPGLGTGNHTGFSTRTVYAGTSFWFCGKFRFLKCRFWRSHIYPFD